MSHPDDLALIGRKSPMYSSSVSGQEIFVSHNSARRSHHESFDTEGLLGVEAGGARGGHPHGEKGNQA